MRNRKFDILKMRFKTRMLVFHVCMFAFITMPVYALVLNEIMYNPDGNENTDEFIEIYNETQFPVRLFGWQISDGEGVDSLIALEQDMLVQPDQYVLILDPDYFMDSSTTYDGMIPENALIVTINNSVFGANMLSNSRAEQISLINPQGITVSVFTYTLGNGNGFSEEKILPEAGDTAVNWTNSIRHHGTPGSRNSVTPPDRDMAVSLLYSDPSSPQANDSFVIWCEVQNTGRKVYGDTLRLMDVYESPIETLHIGSWATQQLLPNESIMFHAHSRMERDAIRQFCGRLSGNDEYEENDNRCILVSSAVEMKLLLINEIMYAPEPQRCEWIELVNPTPFALSYAGWSIGDGTSIADSSRRLRFPQVSLAANGFLIAAADSSILFENVPPHVPIIVWNGTPITLNNTGDSLVLYDPDGNKTERVDYRPSWGNGESGCSIERVSVHSATNNSLNWAASLDSTGSTPGRINSRTLPEFAKQDNLLVLEPNPFSPDGDGKDDILFARYRLDDADSRLDLKIYDVRGRQVRGLANNAPAGYSGEILWDGKSDSGRDVPTGIYIVYLEALGKGGTRVQSAKRPVALVRRS